MWTCPRCGQPNEDSFDECWRCADEGSDVINKTSKEDNLAYAGETRSTSKAIDNNKLQRKSNALRFTFLIMLFILAKHNISTYVEAFTKLYDDGSNFEFNNKILIIPVLGSVAFTVFWRFRRADYIMLVTGQFIFYFLLYNYFGLLGQMAFIFSTLGFLIFMISIIRLFRYFLSESSDDLIDGLLRKRQR